MTKLNITVEKLFQYLENAVVSIPKRYRRKTFQSLAYYLIQWDGISPEAVRAAILKCNEKLEGICVECYNDAVSSHTEGDEDEDEEPLCDECAGGR